MAKAQGIVKVAKPVVVTNVEIDKDDVLAIGITEAEEYMQEQRDAWKVTQRKQLDEAAEHGKRVVEILAAAAVTFAAGIEEQLREGLACLACKKLEFTHFTSAIEPHSGTRKRPTYGVTIRVVSCDGVRNTLTLDRLFVQQAPKEALVEYKAQFKCHDAAIDAGNQSLSWTRRLTRISQYERKLRAELAKARLAQTGEGREILRTMLGDVKNRVLALPGS